MKSRNREINIFNMSLLDILCGALGAFCFMMIVLLPYYKPGKAEDAKRQQEMEKSMKELEELKKNITDPKLAKELEELIKKLQAQIKELEGRVNSLTQENKQLASQNQQLQKEKDTLQQKNTQLEQQNKQLAQDKQQLQTKNEKLQTRNNQLETRMPGVLAAFCSQPLPDGREAALDLFVWSPITTMGGKPQPSFNPDVLFNGVFFNGDKVVPLSARIPTTLFLYRDVAFAVKQKVYIKLQPLEFSGKGPPVPSKLTVPMKVNGFLSSATPDTAIKFPEVELNPQHPWMLLGFLDTDKTGKMKFTEATPAEREAEWRQLDKAGGAGPKK